MKRNENTPLNIIERMNSKISMLVSIIVLVILVVVFNRLDYQMVQKPIDQAKKEAIQKEEAEEAARTAPVISTASVIAVGDNLYHGSLLRAGQNDDGPWNYDKIYDHVKDEIMAADLAIVDQETVLTIDHDAIASYPSFATPTEVGDSLVNVGFDVIEHATNHIDDYTSDFIEQTMNFWQTKHPDIPYLGIHDSWEDWADVKVVEVNGIRIAFLDYTYGTNNSGAGEGNEYMIDMFNVGHDKVAEMIAKAKEKADCVIFIAHWGTEDEPMPNEYEKQWANFLMKQGVDLVIGGHPHVLQPYGVLSDEEGHSMPIYYSLGNFVSTQQELAELIGGMASFTIQKTEVDGETSIEILDQTVKPLVMHYNMDTEEYGPYMLEDYTDELAEQHSVRNYIGDIFTVKNLYRKFEEILSMNVEPSTDTDQLDVRYDWDGTMIDPSGNVVYDNKSTTALQYYGAMGLDVSSSYYSDEDIDYTKNLNG